MISPKQTGLLPTLLLIINLARGKFIHWIIIRYQEHMILKYSIISWIIIESDFENYEK